VVEQVTNRNKEMSFEEARKKDPEAELGDSIGEKFQPQNLAE